MVFNYLEFWSCEDSETTQQQNTQFKEDSKDDFKQIAKPLLTNQLIVIENKHSGEHRQRPKDLNNFFLRRERKTLKELRQ